ncbi:MAG TPA: hypothetical protein VKR79_08900 [Gaiellaceae bacterium]|nr:hypothetical protein [Gaiellaceae bacterium]
MPVGRRLAIVASEMEPAASEGRFCRLEESAGRVVACPEGACAFWEPGGAALEARCVLEGIDFGREPGLAEWLLEVRDELRRAAHR